MKLFPILLIIGISLVIIAIVIESNFDDCLSDVKIGALIYAPASVIAFGTLSFFLGVGCIIGSFYFLNKEKPKTILLGD